MALNSPGIISKKWQGSAWKQVSQTLGAKCDRPSASSDSGVSFVLQSPGSLKGKLSILGSSLQMA